MKNGDLKNLAEDFTGHLFSTRCVNVNAPDDNEGLRAPRYARRCPRRSRLPSRGPSASRERLRLEVTSCSRVVNPEVIFTRAADR